MSGREGYTIARIESEAGVEASPVEFYEKSAMHVSACMDLILYSELNGTRRAAMSRTPDILHRLSKITRRIFPISLKIHEAKLRESESSISI
jgi:hypothetical protein